MISIAVGLYDSIFEVNTWWSLGFSLSFTTSSILKGTGHLFFTISPSLSLSKVLSWFNRGYGFWGRINVKGPAYCVKQGYMNSVWINSGDLNIDYWLKWYLLSFSTGKKKKKRKHLISLAWSCFLQMRYNPADIQREGIKFHLLEGWLPNN